MTLNDRPRAAHPGHGKLVVVGANGSPARSAVSSTMGRRKCIGARTRPYPVAARGEVRAPSCALQGGQVAASSVPRAKS
jgi:hypothetical protein